MRSKHSANASGPWPRSGIFDISNKKERYGMPTINCDEINQIRVDSGLPPLDCELVPTQKYTSAY